MALASMTKAALALLGVVILGVSAGAAYRELMSPSKGAGAHSARDTAATGGAPAAERAGSARTVPDLRFADGAGAPRSLADFRGRVILLNLWATWCVPCRKEMPALDALQRQLGGPGFEVVAVNIDTRDPDKPKAWLAETGIKDLAYYADPSAKIFQDLKAVGKAFGMPTTLVVDPSGCEIAALAGPAEWASGDALTFMKTALGK